MLCETSRVLLNLSVHPCAGHTGKWAPCNQERNSFTFAFLSLEQLQTQGKCLLNESECTQNTEGRRGGGGVGCVCEGVQEGMCPMGASLPEPHKERHFHPSIMWGGPQIGLTIPGMSLGCAGAQEGEMDGWLLC